MIEQSEPVVVNVAGPSWAQRQENRNVIVGAVRAGLVVYDPASEPIEYGDVIPEITVNEIGAENGYQ